MGSIQEENITITNTYTLNIGVREGNGTPLQYSCLENPMDGGAWWSAVYGVAQSRTRLQRLSSSSVKGVTGASNVVGCLTGSYFFLGLMSFLCLHFILPLFTLKSLLFSPSH